MTPIIDDARRGFVSLIDGGRGICNAVYVDDLCDAIMASLASDTAEGEAFLINGDCRLTWKDFVMTFADMVDREKIVHDFSLDELAAHRSSQRPGVKGSVTALVRLLASPSFHAELSSVPPLGKALRSTKELLARRITTEQKSAMKRRLQGRRLPKQHTSTRLSVPSEGRRIREAYRSRVSNDKAKRHLHGFPLHSFGEGARRTEQWLRFARLV